MLDYRMDTFLSVCDTMNYRKTAEQLHITQPAVTQHIQHLERVYGCKLFLYESRRLRQTQAAVTLEQYARRVRTGQDGLMQALRSSPIPSLRVGATKTIGECMAGRYAEKFLAQPDRELTLIVDNTRYLLDAIDHGKLDFAMIEGSFDKTRYGYTRMSLEPFVGICSQDHPFAGKAVCIPRLLQETLICREEGSGTRAILEHKLLEYNESIAHFRRKICISSFPIILDFVRQGLGVSFVFAVLAKQKNLATFTILDSPIQREFNLVYLKNAPVQDKIRCFLGDASPRNLM